jgi:hypothetical protein
VQWGDRDAARVLDDGLGVRRLETDALEGCLVERLDVAPALAARDDVERAIRERAVRLAEANVAGICRVRRIERRQGTLCVVADHVDGLRLPEFLQEAIRNNVPLPQAAALELAGRLTRTVASLHEQPGMCHGAITPSHVVVTRRGEVIVTDAVFGTAIENLQRNREQLWREFRLALPASASLPRIDQRADVACLGATVLGIVLGRPLRIGEYPRAINEAVIAATLAARPGESGTSASALRMWLQEAMHLHPRAAFASGLDAWRAFGGVLAGAAARRGGAASLESAVARVFGDTPESAEAARLARAWSQPAAVHHIDPARPSQTSPQSSVRTPQTAPRPSHAGLR